MSEELMPLADIGRLEDADFWLALDADHINVVQRAINTARAAHRLQEEVERLKKENTSLQAMYDLGVSFHNLKCAELDLAFHKMDKFEVEIEGLRKDAERYRCLRSSNGSGLPIIAIFEGTGYTTYSDGEILDNLVDQAVDVAMKNGGDGEQT